MTEQVETSKPQLLLMFQWPGGGIPEVYRTLIGAGAFQHWHCQQAVLEPIPSARFDYFNQIAKPFGPAKKGSVRFFLQLRRKIQTSQLVVANSIFCLFTLWVLGCWKVPVVFHVHNEYGYLMGAASLRDRIFRKLLGLCCRCLNVTQILCVTATVKPGLAGISVPIEVIENGSLKAQVDQVPSLSPTTVVGMGRLDPEKQFDKFIRVAAEVVKQNRNVQFKIFGEGKLKAQLVQQIEEAELSEYVWLMGFTREPLVEMAKSSMLLTCSSREGSPLVLAEALSLGVPVVSSRVGVAKYYFDKTDAVFVSDDELELAKRILELAHLSEPEFVDLCSEGRCFYERHMSMERKVEDYGRCFDAAASL